MRAFSFLGFRQLCENHQYITPSEQALFLSILLQVAQKTDLVNRREKFSFSSVGILHALYNVKLSVKHENLLKEMCWND